MVACQPEPVPAPNPEPKLRFVEVVTRGADTNDTLPLLIGVHGLGDTPQQFWRAVERRFETKPVRMIFPAGPREHGGGYAWFSSEAFSASPADYAKAIQSAGDELATFIQTMSQSRPTLGKPIVFGFSQGGILAFYTAIHHGELIDMAIPIAGALPNKLLPSGKGTFAPVTAFHGMEDKRLSFDGSRHVIEILEKYGGTATLKPFPFAGHTVTPEMLRQIEAELVTAVDRIYESEQSDLKAAVNAN